MKKSTLLKKVKRLGFPLFETEESLDANETLAEVAKSKDTRLWEGFPVMLANSLKKGFFDYKSAYACLKGMEARANFKDLVIMSLALYEYLELSFPHTDKLFNSNSLNKTQYNEFLNCFREDKALKTAKGKLPVSRLVDVFENYFRKEENELGDYMEIKDKFDLEYSLSQLFSKKQKELLFKKLKGEKMTKTEREYFSRSVKKKLLALADTNLHNLALKLAKS